MNAAVTAQGPDAADQLRSLHEWLSQVEELRGSVACRESPPPPGALGPVLDALTVALGPAGAVTAFGTTVVAWLRLRRTGVRIKVTRADGGSVELAAENLAKLDAVALEQQVAHVVTLLNETRSDTEHPTADD
ncbi:effector-associated constant component EACC1 [Streptomyces puniciscabiei]